MKNPDPKKKPVLLSFCGKDMTYSIVGLTVSEKIFFRVQRYAAISLYALLIGIFLFSGVLHSQNPPVQDIASDPHQTPSDAIRAAIKALEERIARSRKEETGENADQAGILLSDLQKRTKMLTEIRHVYERHLSESDQQKEFEAVAADIASQKETYFEKKPQYSLSLSDDHQINLSKKIQIREEVRIDRDVSEKLLKEAKNDLDKAELHLKAAQEKAEKAKEDVQIHQARWELVLSEIEKELSEAVYEYRKILLENRKTAFEIAAQIAEIYHSHSDYIRNHLQFSQEDLDHQIQTVIKYKNSIRNQFEKMKKKADDAEQAYIRKQKNVFQPVREIGSDESETLKTSAILNSACKKMVGHLEMSLTLLSRQETVWRQRYELIQQEPDYEKLLSVQKDARSQTDQILKTIGTLQTDQMDIQIQIADIDKKLSMQSGGQADLKHLKEQMTVLRELSNNNFQYMGILQATKNLYGRLFEETGSMMEKVSIYHKLRAAVRYAMNFQIYQNTLIDYCIALITFVIGLLVIGFLKKVVFSRINKWTSQFPTMFDDYLVNAIEKTAMPILYFGVFYLSLRGLTLHPIISKLTYVIGIGILTFYIIRFLINIADFVIKEYWLKKEDNIGHESSIKAIIPIIKVAAWAIGIFFVLDNLGFKISAVIAGLGIGGIAIALAAQNILGDLFNYFVILFDRPFEIGDYITINEYKGTIEHIGIKTTRLRSLSGEQLIFANTDLTGSRVSNFKRMEKRRASFSIGVTYQTPESSLREIPAIISDIIGAITDTVFERAHFSAYGDFSLIFEVVYYVIGRDYIKYMDIQQEINLSLKNEFEKRHIEFAYPTQTLLIQNAPPADKARRSVPGIIPSDAPAGL